MKLCAVNSCDRPSRKRGWCSHHYDKWWRTGDPSSEAARSNHRKRNPRLGLYGREWVLAIIPYDGDDCLFWPFNSKDRDGYPIVGIGNKSRRASRYICQLAHGDAPTPRHEAAHSCGNGHLGCLSPTHLSWKTSLENHQDKISHGTTLLGEASPNSRLTGASVAAIRRDAANGVAPKKLAAQHSVSRAAIYDILKFRTWKHVPENRRAA